MVSHALDLVQGSFRYGADLPRFLRTTLSRQEAEAMVQSQLQGRNTGFVRLLELGVYGNPRSPYRRLLEHAGVSLEDARTLVEQNGVEGALSRLHDAGIFVSLEEFKGRAPVRRGSLQFEVSDRDFDNPLLVKHYEGTTGGSRGGGTRVPIDFDFLAFESAEWLCDLYNAGDADVPQVLWHRGPPGPMGIRTTLILAHLGRVPPEWFSPTQTAWNRQGLQGRMMLGFTHLAGRLSGKRLPRPRYVPTAGDLAVQVAKYVRGGTPATVHCMMSQAVRVCLAAEQAGLNIWGTRFRSGGEPYTDSKAAVFERLGCSVSPAYSMSEAGSVSLGCGTPFKPDDMHLMRHRMALLQRPVQVAPSIKVQGFILTSLSPASPKLMLNVETGDYGVAEERDCGCSWHQRGFTTHVHSVRSYEKLTSEGVTFMGSMLHELLEETLPRKFGGSITDYQFVEEEEGGVPFVSLVVSPRVGALNEEDVKKTILDQLGFAEWSRLQAETWRQEGSLKVVRREPYATMTGKILPLHVMSPPAREDAQTDPEEVIPNDED